MDPTTQAILDSVQQFYSNAWSQLILFTTAIMALVGIIIPIISQAYQRSSSITDKKELEILIKEEAIRIKKELQVEMNSEYEAIEKDIEKSLKETQNKIRKDNDVNRGGISHVQGIQLIKENNFYDGTESIISAAASYLKGDDESNLRRTLFILISACIPRLSRADIERMTIVNNPFDELIDLLRKKNENNRYGDEIGKILTLMSEANRR
jgi:hypothetical protein